MLEPKVFYRKLDFIQNKIGKHKKGKDFLDDIASEMEKTFSEDLKMKKPSIYEKNDDEFILVSTTDKKVKEQLPKNVKIENPAIQAVIKNRIFIYNNNEIRFPEWQNGNKKYGIPAALTVSSPENRWIFLFELTEGWIREEIEFCLNAVRTALNYRLVSDSVKNDMQQAVQIQKSLLPVEPPEVEGFDICGRSQPAELVGGDLYDYFQFEGNSFGFCLGDASGHGLPAALLARDAITGLRMGLEKHMKLIHTIKKLNKVIFRSVYSTRFISLFYAEIEDNGNLFYANAGHPAPLLFNDTEIVELDSTGTILGALPEVDIRRSFVQADKGSILAIFSDGIFERENRNGEQFELDRFKELILKYKSLSAKDIVDKVFEETHKFGHKKKWQDDATLVIIKRD